MWLEVLPADKCYRISWGKGRPYPLAYEVTAARLQDAARNVREKLERLADWFGSNDETRRRNLLVDLASAGADFYFQLFNCPPKAREIRRLKDWLRDEFAVDTSLEIRAPSGLQIPWGLVYYGEPPSPVNEDADSQLLEVSRERMLFAPFWCLTHELHVTQGNFVRPRSEMRRPRATFRLLPLLNSDVERQIHREERGCEQYEADLFAGAARCYKEGLSLISKEEFSDAIFYFLGHHDDAKLELGSGEVITDKMFGRLMERLSDKILTGSSSSCGLIFLNGCQSASGENTNLRYYTETEELCGIIATECRVPTQFAHKLGVKLLTLLTRQGKCVKEAMRAIYDDPAFWPLSLIYGCYADPLYEVEEQKSEPAPAMPPPGAACN